MVITGQLGFLCRQVYREAGEQANIQTSNYQASMQVSEHGSNQALATHALWRVLASGI